jgi:hypothetical protein
VHFGDCARLYRIVARPLGRSNSAATGPRLHFLLRNLFDGKHFGIQCGVAQGPNLGLLTLVFGAIPRIWGAGWGIGGTFAGEANDAWHPQRFASQANDARHRLSS